MVKYFKYINVDVESIDYDGKNVVVYGRGVTAINVLKELKQKNTEVIGFVDSYSTNNEFFAGKKCFELSELKLIPSLVVFIAISNIESKREALYLIEKMDIGDSLVVGHGLVYGAGEYDIVHMERLVEQNKDKIEFVRERLKDNVSKKVFDNLIKYRTTNERKLVEEIYETSHKQYFPVNDFLTFEKEEMFVDCGGYDGGSTIDFFEWAKASKRRSIIFEADDFMYEICLEMMRLKNIKDVRIVKKAVYDKPCSLNFDCTNNLSGSAQINANGHNKVKATSIDCELSNENITFIKMDIEGAEMEALLGCSNTIMKTHPKLAISVYHKEDDLWEIPFYLMKKYPFYKFYMRHYTPYTTETVLYAVEEN